MVWKELYELHCYIKLLRNLCKILKYLFDFMVEMLLPTLTNPKYFPLEDKILKYH